MASRPVMTSTERFKKLLANALEFVCVLEEQLETVNLELALTRAELESAQKELAKKTRAARSRSTRR